MGLVKTCLVISAFCFYVVSCDVIFVNNYANVSDVDEYLDFNPHNETYVFMGDLESCTHFRFQRDVQKYNQQNLIVRRREDIDRVCVFTDDFFPDIPDSFTIDYNLMYEYYSGLDNAVYGNEKELVSTRYFGVKLLTLNRDIGFSLGWLLNKISLAQASALTPTLYVLAINSIEFNNDYDRKLFTKIMESGQILHLILSVANENFPNATVVPNSPAKLFFNMKALDMSISIRMYERYNDSVVTRQSRHHFNFIENLECNYTTCYKDCFGAPNNDSICISLPEQLNRHFNGSVRHLRFEVDKPACSNGVRMSRSAEESKSYPYWFIQYLINNNMVKVATEFLYGESFLSIGDAYLQIINPSYSILYEAGSYIKDCVRHNDYMPFNTFPQYKISLNTKSGLRLPIQTLAECYHLITEESSDVCLKYNNELIYSNYSTHVMSNNEYIIDEFDVATRVHYIRYETWDTTTSATSTTTTTTTTTSSDSTTQNATLESTSESTTPSS